MTIQIQVCEKKEQLWPECVRFEHHSVLTEDQSRSSERLYGGAVSLNGV